jgi:hypothetical protein
VADDRRMVLGGGCMRYLKIYLREYVAEGTASLPYGLRGGSLREFIT